MMENVEEQEQVPICDFCDDALRKPATNTCINCSASYCKAHFNTQHHRPDQSKHVVVPPTCRRSDYVCPEHDEVVQMFCQVEQKALCVLCVNLGTHKEHDVLRLDVAMRAKKEVLQADLDYLENAIATSEAEVNNLIVVTDKVKERAQMIKDNIEHAIDEAKLEFEKVERELIEQVKKEEQNFSTKVNIEIDISIQDQEMMTNIKSKTNAVLECTFPIVFLKRYQDLESNRKPDVRKSLTMDLKNEMMKKLLNIEETNLLREPMKSINEQKEVWTIPSQSLQIENEIYTGSITKVFTGECAGALNCAPALLLPAPCCCRLPALIHHLGPHVLWPGTYGPHVLWPGISVGGQTFAASRIWPCGPLFLEWRTCHAGGPPELALLAINLKSGHGVCPFY
uniref:tripartite motif-containing protein 16-like n=1 Tax=Myxine glutinosa TaxID=7769 RepID=UPI00358E1C98